MLNERKQSSSINVQRQACKGVSEITAGLS
jgi:hypothetical protein